MKFFLKKVLKWLTFLFLTVLFFALPVILQKESGPAFREDSLKKQIMRQANGSREQSEVYFEFEPESVKERILGDSTGLRMITISDTSEKYVYLFVNGEKQDVAIVSDSMQIEFSRVYLKLGINEITAILQRPAAETLAVRRATIFSLKKM
jgi:hypothetical protein